MTPSPSRAPGRKGRAPLPLHLHYDAGWQPGRRVPPVLLAESSSPSAVGPCSARLLKQPSDSRGQGTRASGEASGSWLVGTTRSRPVTSSNVSLPASCVGTAAGTSPGESWGTVQKTRPRIPGAFPLGSWTLFSWGHLTSEKALQPFPRPLPHSGSDKRTEPVFMLETTRP